jgi:hypothetical protein
MVKLALVALLTYSHYKKSIKETIAHNIDYERVLRGCPLIKYKLAIKAAAIGS